MYTILHTFIHTVGAIDIETHSFTSSTVKYGFYIDLSIWKPYFTGLEVGECVSISIIPTVHTYIHTYIRTYIRTVPVTIIETLQIQSSPAKIKSNGIFKFAHLMISEKTCWKIIFSS